MVSALQNQRISRRSGMNCTQNRRPARWNISMRSRNKMLVFLFAVTIILLLSSSVVFSLAMINTAEDRHRRPGEKPPGEDKKASLTLDNTAVPGDLEEDAAGLQKADPGPGENALPAVEIEGAIENANYDFDWEEGKKTEIPAEYIIRAGDTIYDLAVKYDVSIYRLILENKIADPTRLQINDRIVLPAGLNQVRNAVYAPSINTAKRLPDKIEISASTLSGTAPLAVKYRLKTALNSDSLLYIWDFGNDRFAFAPEAGITYPEAGEYQVFLMVSDQENNQVYSNKLYIHVKPALKNARKIDIDEAGGFHFVTSSQVNEILDFNTYLAGKSRIAFDPEHTVIRQSALLLKHVAADQFLTVQPGYSRITITSGTLQFRSYLFVSPYPSRHVFEPDYEWYKTQFKTGFNGNCGPACVAMAVQWAKGENVTVQAIRNEIGMPVKSGAINFHHMFEPFKKHKTNAFFTPVQSSEDLRNIIDRGNLAIFVYSTGGIRKTAGDKTKNMTGRYYADRVGHYSIIKGYSLDKKYFVVYDPIPSDWRTNELRYADGRSMLGKNRYYPAEQVIRALRRRLVIEVSRG